MKRQKALAAIIFALLVALMVSGCTGNGEEAETTEPETTQYQDETTEVTPDVTIETTSPVAIQVDVEDFNFSEGMDENGFWIGIRALDYVEMFNYAALPIPAEAHAVDPEEFALMLNSILAEVDMTEPVTDRAVVDGDTVNIDFVGSVDGEEFPGGSTGGMGTVVTIGVTQYIDDFLDQLVGHMPGSVVNVNVTFPEDYLEESLQGAEALFVTTINYIMEEIHDPVLTDEFVIEHFGMYGWTGVDDMTAEINEFLQETAISQFLENYLNTEVVVSAVPESIVRYHEQLMVRHFIDTAAQWGMDFDEFLMGNNYDSIEAFIESSRTEIDMEARLSLIRQAVAEDAGIIADTDDVTAFFMENFGQEDFSMFEELYGLPWLKQSIRNQMVMDFITENVVLE